MSCTRIKKIIICIGIIVGINLILLCSFGYIKEHRTNKHIMNKAFVACTIMVKQEKIRLDKIEEQKRKEAEEERRKNGWISSSQFMSQGVVYYGGLKYTWYSERVLPGGGLVIPGRHINTNGYVSDGEGYIVIASCDFVKGTVLETPFGLAKVYDVCPTSGVVDVYVGW